MSIFIKGFGNFKNENANERGAYVSLYEGMDFQPLDAKEILALYEPDTKTIIIHTFKKLGAIHPRGTSTKIRFETSEALDLVKTFETFVGLCDDNRPYHFRYEKGKGKKPSIINREVANILISNIPLYLEEVREIK